MKAPLDYVAPIVNLLHRCFLLPAKVAADGPNGSLQFRVTPITVLRHAVVANILVWVVSFATMYTVMLGGGFRGFFAKYFEELNLGNTDLVTLVKVHGTAIRNGILNELLKVLISNTGTMSTLVQMYVAYSLA